MTAIRPHNKEKGPERSGPSSFISAWPIVTGRTTSVPPSRNRASASRPGGHRNAASLEVRYDSAGRGCSAAAAGDAYAVAGRGDASEKAADRGDACAAIASDPCEHPAADRRAESESWLRRSPPGCFAPGMRMRKLRSRPKPQPTLRGVDNGESSWLLLCLKLANRRNALWFHCQGGTAHCTYRLSNPICSCLVKAISPRAASRRGWN